MEKGMSQTITLIVTATVVMMTAVIVIYMARGSLGDVVSSSGKEKCISGAQSKCNFGGADTATVPSCGQVDGSVDAENIDGVDSISGSSIECG